jgi:hypothetical protein
MRLPGAAVVAFSARGKDDGQPIPAQPGTAKVQWADLAKPIQKRPGQQLGYSTFTQSLSVVHTLADAAIVPFESKQLVVPPAPPEPPAPPWPRLPPTPAEPVRPPLPP